MIFRELDLPGTFVIDLDPFVDERGTFARTFCRDEFEAHGVESAVAQCGLSKNTAKQTLRGMHLQLAPHEEAKVVRCVRGSAFDVVVDLRRDSPTLGGWVGVRLDADEGTSVAIPRGMAHGFLTLEPETWVEYTISAAYAPDSAAGIRWDDPAIGIEWPAVPEVMSSRDRALPSVDLDRLRTEGLVAALR